MSTEADAEFDRWHNTMNEFVNRFKEQDKATLACLSVEDRTEQQRARKILYDYVTLLWDTAKRSGLRPTERPEFASVAAMCDLAGALWATAGEACVHAEALSKGSPRHPNGISGGSADGQIDTVVEHPRRTRIGWPDAR